MGVKFLVGARGGTSGRRIEMGALRVHITGAPLSLPPFSLLSLAAALHQPRHIKLAVSPLLPQAEDGGQSLGGRLPEDEREHTQKCRQTPDHLQDLRGMVVTWLSDMGLIKPQTALFYW